MIPFNRPHAAQATQRTQGSTNRLEVLHTNLSGKHISPQRRGYLAEIYIERQFMGLMMWPCAMSMWFYWMSLQGLGFYDVILVYNQWADGYKGYSIDDLTYFVSVGQCI
jgi:hypothetical protein